MITGCSIGIEFLNAQQLGHLRSAVCANKLSLRNSPQMESYAKKENLLIHKLAIDVDKEDLEKHIKSEVVSSDDKDIIYAKRTHSVTQQDRIQFPFCNSVLSPSMKPG